MDVAILGMPLVIPMMRATGMIRFIPRGDIIRLLCNLREPLSTEYNAQGNSIAYRKDKVFLSPVSPLSPS